MSASHYSHSVQTNKASWLQHFSKVSVKLRVNILFTFAAFTILGYQGVTGMQESEGNLDTMYRQGMQQSFRTSKVIDELGNARSSLLLAFQHDPSSKFASMHDHPIDRHISDIESAITNLHRIVDDELLTSDLRQEHFEVVKNLASTLDVITEQGFNPAIEQLHQQDFSQANFILLTKINPLYIEAYQSADSFLSMQEQQGAASFKRAQENTHRFIVVVSTIAVIALLFITAMSLFIARRINQSAQQLEHSASDIAAGDLTQRIAIQGNDEFNDIAESVNKIVSSFQHVVQTNRDSIDQLAKSAESNSAIAEQTKQNIVSQQAQTEQVATAINEFTATVHEVAQSAASAADASEQADLAAESGQNVVKQSIEMIESLSQELQESVESMHVLAQHSEEIGSVVDVIQGISEQTNLLALNAAIEAARAGEQGRGFAVVADEVRSLASKTQESTQEILQTIQRLQQGSRDSTQRLEAGANSALATVEKSREAGESLIKIKESVDQISAMNVQIATAAEEQSLVTEEINANISAISEISQQTATGAEQSSTATHELAQLSDTLKNEIEHYRV